ncbi:hypothetical protein PR048_005231 [Dryococelus australis]|uniref:Uncharacterized protein n=1 Tax=Dryococelus australis TaxID=614101 RepID=A0ABQ9I7J8_9NEOP|nr:hypothetical protein PR048_005231 [Dryococelus australis]
MASVMYLETTPDVLTTFAMDASWLLSNNPSSMLVYMDSNYAEHFNHAVAKIIEEAMKQNARVLFCNITLASMAKYKLHKTIFGTNPGMFSKTCQINRQKEVNLDRERRNNRPKTRRNLFTGRYQKLKADKDYGANIQAPDMP